MPFVLFVGLNCSFILFLCLVVVLICCFGGCVGGWMVKNGGPKTVKNGPRVWAFCKIEFPGIQKPVQIFDQKTCFFKKCGNRGVGVIWLVCGCVVGFVGCLFVVWFGCFMCWCCVVFTLGSVLMWVVVVWWFGVCCCCLLLC